MSSAEQTVVGHASESLACERALAQALRSHIDLAPRGSHRKTLETHVRQSEDHAERLEERLRELGHGRSVFAFGIGLLTGTIERTLALGLAPLRIARGAGEEQVLKQAEEDCARHARAIATHAALEDVARTLDDAKTAQLAVTLRERQQKMLERLLREVPRLASAVVDAEVYDRPSYESAQTGAADTVRSAGREVRATAKRAGKQSRKTARRARKVPGVARAEGEIKGALASQSDLPIARYDSLSAAEVVERLAGLSQIDLAKIDAYERRNENRSTITSRIAALRGQEPWPGYDELGVEEVRSVISEGNEGTARRIASYERSHKHRTGVLEAAEREFSHSGSGTPGSG